MPTILKKLLPAATTTDDAFTTSSPRSAPRASLRERVATWPRPRPELAALLVLAAVLNLWALDQNGWANEYYSAAIRSMSTSWHDFIYNSFDASGVMTVDKPPLALWVQALSVRAFGFHSLSILIPQALMGMASVALVYDLVRRRFGRIAGAAGGLVLATTPITVAISRHNNPDALLVLCSVAALWFLVRGLEDGRTKWIVWAGVMVGLGFETKMAAALMVVPGMAAAWLWVAPRGRVTAIKQLLAGGGAMLAVGAAWPLLVTLTPAADRPWVSGTSDNSIWSLIFNYNGLGRLDGQAGGPQAFGGGGPFGGPTGPFRLLEQSLGGQAGWLLGAALVGGAGILVATRLKRADARTGWLFAVGGAFLTTAVAFSYASGIFHPYYVSLLAPFTAALVGGTVGTLGAGGLTARILAPLAVAGGIFSELVVLHDDATGLGWLPTVLVVGGGLACAALAAVDNQRVRAAALGIGCAVLLIAPVTWSVQTLGHATSGTFPAGGPVSSSFGGPGGPGGAGGPGGGLRRFGGPAPGAGPTGGAGAAPGAAAGGPPALGLVRPGGAAPSFGGGQPTGGAGGGGPFGGSQSLTQVTRYVAQHGGGTVGISSQQGASSSIISSGANVAALGGFSGRESEVNAGWLAAAVQSNKIRWVLTDGSGGAGPGSDGRVGSSKLMAAVAATCRKVPSSAYLTSTSGATTGGALYDCQGRSAALAAYRSTAS